MQRSFSFQAHDDDPGYRALPLLPDGHSPPNPPLHDSTPRYSGDYERQPLNTAQYTPTKQSRYTNYSYSAGNARHDSSASSVLSVSSITRVGELGAPSQRLFQNEDLYSNRERQPAPGHPPRSPIAAYSYSAGNVRHDSSASSSSVSSVSSITRVGELGAPSQRSLQNQDLYSNRERQPAPGHPPRSPIAAAGGNKGETSASTGPGHETFPQTEPIGEENPTLTEPAGYREEEQGRNQSRGGNGAYFMEPAATGGQYTSLQHSPTDPLYTQPGQAQPYSSPHMSQANLSLVPTGSETPSSRFTDPAPPTPPHTQGRFADPSSPPTPHAFAQPPHEIGGNTQEVLPLPPPHRMGTQPNRSTDRVLNDPVGGHYTDNPYNRYSTTWDPQLSASQIQINGTAKDAETFVFSDDDEPVEDRSRGGAGYVAAAGTPAAASVTGGRGANTTPPRSAGTAVAGGVSALTGIEVSSTLLNEKTPPSEWLQKQTNSKKKSRWIIGLVLLFIILAAAGGATAGILLKKKNTSSASTSTSTSGGGGGLSASQDVAQNGNLDKNSKEIIALMNNSKLKKAFYGIDYTPLNTQYPDCLKNPPTQNNITRDVAVMSLLTNKLRLYGTDCNQTEMVLHAISVLDIPMKIWLGVWLDKNTTTNDRQLKSLYKILANYPADRFEGVAVGNEVLFRQDLTETQLFSTIADVRRNLSSLSISLPVGTSDLGSNWKSTMVPYVDVLMANVHPFFAGVVVEKAANWTWTFFQENDVVLTNGLTTKPTVMISEVGWPSAGGNDSGSVAGISEMNTFMADFLCTENKRRTEYYWFEAFDEPWKVVYNEAGKQWEDKWGLMDVNRNLKDGVVIPDCLVTY